MTIKINKIEDMAKILKVIIDEKESIEYWSSILPYLNDYPDLFFGVLDIRYLGKRRIERLSTVMAYEQKCKEKNSMEKLVYNHLSKKISQKNSKTTLHSIGYETMDPEKFIEKLKRNNINLLIDVREKAISRKRGFSKTILKTALAEASIEYIHMKELGSPSKDRKNLHENNNWAEFSRKYYQYLEGKKDSLVEVCKKAKEKKSCLMCFEREYTKCHRSLITSRIQEMSGIEGVHL